MLVIKHTYNILFLLIGMGAFCLAQTPQLIVESERFDRHHGLINASLLKFVQDKDGFHWSYDLDKGLYRFNGQHFEHFSKDFFKIDKSDYFDLFVDADGMFWVTAINQGSQFAESYVQQILIMDPSDLSCQSLAAYYKELPFSESQVHSIYPSAATIIVLLEDGQIYHYHSGQFQKKAQLKHFPTSVKSFSYHIQDQSYYYTHKRQLYKYELHTQKETSLFPEEQIDFVFYNNGLLYFENYIRKQYGTTHAGFFYDTKTKKRYDFLKEQKDKSVNKLLSIVDKDIWAFKVGGQLLLVQVDESGVNNLYQLDQDVLADHSSNFSFASIAGGRLWVSYYDYALAIQLTQLPFEHYLSEGKLSVRDIVAIDSSSLICTTYKGLKKVDLNSKQYSNPFPSFKGIQGYGLCKTDEYMYIGIHGFFVYQHDLSKNEGRLLDCTAAVNEKSGVARIPFVDTLGRLWVGLENKGIVKREDGMFRSPAFASTSKLQATIINNVIPYKNNYWLASNKGAYLFDPIAEQLIDSIAVENQESIVHIYPLAADSIWLVPQDAHPYLYHPSTARADTLKIYHPSQGNGFHAILPDKQNAYWLPSNNGLYRYCMETNNVRRFSTQNALPFDEFNRISYEKLANGHLALGGIEGFIVIDPDRYKVFPKPKNNKIHFYELEEFFANAPSIKHYPEKGKTLLFSNDLDELRIRFAYLEPIQKNKAQYYYRLNVQHKEHGWKKIEGNELVLTGVKAGTHTLEVGVKIGDNQSFTTTQKLTYSIAYPFYLQWQWLLGTILCLVFLVRFIIKFRLRQLQQKQEELEQIIDQRTEQLLKDKLTIELQKSKLETQKDELLELNQIKDKIFAVLGHEMREPLIGVLGLSQKINYLIKNHEFEYIDEISTQLDLYSWNTQDMLQNLLNWGELMLKEENTFIESFYIHAVVENVIAQLKERSEAKQLRIVNQITPKTLIDFDKQGFKIIIRNLLSNAVKYSSEGDLISIQADTSSQYWSLVVKDQGVGMSQRVMDNINQAIFLSSSRGTLGEKGVGLGLKICTIIAKQNYCKLYFKVNENAKGVSAHLVYTQMNKNDVCAGNLM